MVNPHQAHGSQQGLAYIALLLGVAITGASVAVGGSLWSHVQRREREKQLLWAGDQIRKAIVDYSRFAADPANRFPRELQDLLLDPRSSAPRRYLRQIYEDPMTRSTDWGLIRNPQGRIVGVHSRSAGVPVKTGNFGFTAYASFEKAATYADWRFTAVTEARTTAAPGAQPAASAPAADPAASPRPFEPAMAVPKVLGQVPSAARPALPASAPARAPDSATAAEPAGEAPDQPHSDDESNGG